MQTFQPITFSIPHPASLFSIFKPINFNANWNYNHGSGISKTYQAPSITNSYVPPPPPPPTTTTTTTQTPHHPQQTHSFQKQFNWDVNWNFNHGSSSTLGAASGKEEAPAVSITTTTEKPASLKPVSNSQHSNGYHGVKKVNVELALNVNHGSGSSGNVSPSINLQPPNKSSSDDNDDFDDSIDDEKDANNESTRR